MRKLFTRSTVFRTGPYGAAAVLMMSATLHYCELATAQDLTEVPTTEAAGEELSIEAPEKVEIDPLAEDKDISSRLMRIYNATGWYENVKVTTDEGVVFVEGLADSERHRDWAERVALRTADVVAVVNRVEVRERSVWDVSPAIAQMRQLGRDFVQATPLLVFGAAVIVVAYFLAKLASRSARYLAARRINSQLLLQVVSSVIAVLVMLAGLYVALKVSGLSRLAVTVLGGTGLIGLALGFAFRDIAENYLASILISLNRPFNVGDLIEMDGGKGFVRRVTTRGTLLLTASGNHIQIPNSTIYKSIITNYSSSPRLRESFVIGIGYDDSVSEAQEVILATLKEHQSVLDDPAPLVLVDTLAASTVNLNVMYWLDGERFGAASVSSALMRHAKAALEKAKISMPDEAREVVFPNGVPVQVLEKLDQAQSREARRHVPPMVDGSSESKPGRDLPQEAGANDAEGDLKNTDHEIQRHADRTEVEAGENLIA